MLKVTAARSCHRQKTEGLYKKSFDNAGEYFERKEKRIKAKLDKSSADEVEAKRVKLWLTRFFKMNKIVITWGRFCISLFFQDGRTVLAIFDRGSNHVRILSALIYSMLEFKKAV